MHSVEKDINITPYKKDAKKLKHTSVSDFIYYLMKKHNKYPVYVLHIPSNNTIEIGYGNDSNLLIVFYVQIMPDDLVMQLHRF